MTHGAQGNRKGGLRKPARLQPTARAKLSELGDVQAAATSEDEARFLKSLIRDIPDFPQPGILFRDITPLLGHAQGLMLTTELLARGCAGATAIAGVESRGFIFGVPVAQSLGVPFIPLRKPGKLPAATLSESYDLEYGSATLEMHTDALGSEDRVVLIDDLLATGGTAAAASRLIRRSGAELLLFACVIELAGLKGREILAETPVSSLIRYD